MLPRFWGGLPDPSGSSPGLVSHVASALPDPSCIAGQEQGHWYSHFHARATALRGMLECARVAHDARVLGFVRRAYEFTWTLGIPHMGWVNTYLVVPSHCAGCALWDLVALATGLSDAGAGDCWDDVDAVVRNQLVEQQLTRSDLLERVSAASAPLRPEEKPLYPKQAIYGPEEVVSFPVHETVASHTAKARTSGEKTHTCTFRGSTLVDISPRDESPTSYPLCLREPLRHSAAPMKQVVRFVAEKTIVNW